MSNMSPKLEIMSKDDVKVIHETVAALMDAVEEQIKKISPDTYMPLSVTATAASQIVGEFINRFPDVDVIVAAKALSDVVDQCLTHSEVAQAKIAELSTQTKH